MRRLLLLFLLTLGLYGQKVRLGNDTVGQLPVNQGGTNATTEANARTSLGAGATVTCSNQFVRVVGAASSTCQSIVTADLPATAVTPDSYGDSTHIVAVTIDATGRITAATSTAIGNAPTATALAADPANCSAGALPRGIAASGAAQNCAAVDLAAEVTGALPIENMANSGVSAATYGSATQVPVFTVDAKGNVTAVTDTTITGSTTVNSQSCALGGSCTVPAYATVQDEGSNLTQRTKLNMKGTGVNCVDNSGDGSTDCTVASAVGNNTSTGAFASNPGTCTDGDVRFPSDSFYLLRCLSNAWVPWGPIFPLTAPPSSFSWVNQGSATITTTNGGVTLYSPAAATAALHLRCKTVPTAPYTVTAGFIPLQGTPNFSGTGLALYDSGSGKLVLLELGENGFTRASKWTDTATYSADYSFNSAISYRGGLFYLRFVDNNTDRKSQMSFDGVNFWQIHSVGRTDFITPDKVCFFVHNENATYDVIMNLLSYKEE